MWTCKKAKESTDNYCGPTSTFKKDVFRCCPESCGTGVLTKEQCYDLEGHGKCTYPNDAQCPEGNDNKAKKPLTSKLSSQ